MEGWASHLPTTNSPLHTTPPEIPWGSELQIEGAPFASTAISSPIAGVVQQPITGASVWDAKYLVGPPVPLAQQVSHNPHQGQGDAQQCQHGRGD